jgi:hypothetical protein
VDAELASARETSNLWAHFGHFMRFPALMLSGRFKISPHF